MDFCKLAKIKEFYLMCKRYRLDGKKWAVDFGSYTMKTLRRVIEERMEKCCLALLESALFLNGWELA